MCHNLFIGQLTNPEKIFYSLGFLNTTNEREKYMKGNEKVISTLNSLLADELSAISQYMVHSEMCNNWGYARLHKAVEDRAKDEMDHAEILIGRILFLEGISIVSKLSPIKVGANVETQIANDIVSEAGAINSYNAAIKEAGDLGDHGTRDMLVQILKDEEAHIDWLEAQQDQISQMGIQVYLSIQVKE
jgi:bacterioferritin